MKKLLLMGCLLLAVPALSEECAKGAGYVIIGNDNTRYCASRHEMNWWSAFAWCDAAGGQLFDLSTQCYLGGSSGACPNLGGSLDLDLHRGYAFWTRNSLTTHAASIVSGGGVVGSRSKANRGTEQALCSGSF